MNTWYTGVEIPARRDSVRGADIGVYNICPTLWRGTPAERVLTRREGLLHFPRPFKGLPPALWLVCFERERAGFGPSKRFYIHKRV